LSGAATGRREATKQANRAAILDAAREAFAELGYGATTVRDIIRRTDLASGTFYNYFPDKESVFRALVEEVGGQARVRVRAGRLRATSVEGFVRGGFRAYFEYLLEDPLTSALNRRNAGAIRALFDDATLLQGTDELRADLEQGVAAGLLPPHDTARMAAAMVGAGVELGMRMLEEDPPDVDATADFAAALFLAALR
jgi:AcrR family transcriptional regulator